MLSLHHQCLHKVELFRLLPVQWQHLKIGLYLADLLGCTETGVDKILLHKFSIAKGFQSLVAVAEVGDSGMLNILNLCPDFQGDSIRVVAKEAITDEFRS